MTLDDAERVIGVVESCLSEVGVDPETGRRDVDVIAVGKSKTQQDRIKSIRDIIRELQKEIGGANIEKIKEKASEQGLDPDKVEREIEKLKQTGELYEERLGYYKLAYQ